MGKGGGDPEGKRVPPSFPSARTPTARLSRKGGRGASGGSPLSTRSSCVRTEPGSGGVKGERSEGEGRGEAANREPYFSTVRRGKAVGSGEGAPGDPGAQEADHKRGPLPHRRSAAAITAAKRPFLSHHLTISPLSSRAHVCKRLTAPSWGRSTDGGDGKGPGGGAGELPGGKGPGPAPAVMQRTRVRAQWASTAAAAGTPPPPGEAIPKKGEEGRTGSGGAGGPWCSLALDYQSTATARLGSKAGAPSGGRRGSLRPAPDSPPPLPLPFLPPSPTGADSRCRADWQGGSPLCSSFIRRPQGSVGGGPSSAWRHLARQALR